MNYKKLKQAILRRWSLLYPTEYAPSLPYTLQIEPTNRCNLSCNMCARDYFTKNTKIGDLTFSNFTKIVDPIADTLKVLTLTGWGEPFLNKDLIKMINYGKEKGIDNVHTFTNLTLLTEDLSAKIVDSKLDYISCSLDAVTPEVYKKIRGVDVKPSIFGLKNLLEARRKANTESPYVRIGATITPYNLKEIPKLVRFSASVGVDYIAFKTGASIGSKRQDLVLGRAVVKEKYVNEGIKLMERYGVESNLNNFLDESMEIIGKNEMYMENIPCYDTWLGVFVGWRGDVRLCCSFYDDFIVLGNAVEESIKDIWNNDKYRAYRRKFMDGIPPHKVCLSCDVYRKNLSYDRMIDGWRRKYPLFRFFPKRKPIHCCDKAKD